MAATGDRRRCTYSMEARTYYVKSNVLQGAVAVSRQGRRLKGRMPIRPYGWGRYGATKPACAGWDCCTHVATPTAVIGPSLWDMIYYYCNVTLTFVRSFYAATRSSASHNFGALPRLPAKGIKGCHRSHVAVLVLDFGAKPSSGRRNGVATDDLRCDFVDGRRL